MRTLRHVLDDELFRRLATERKLKPMDVRFYLYCSFHPLASIAVHSEELGVNREVLRRCFVRLREAGWAYAGPRSPAFRGALVIPWMPVHVETAVVAQLSQLRGEIHYYGEWLMKCSLDVLIHDRAYRDNARPQWLINPRSGRKLELDRWYPGANMAFEFQGPQHYSANGELIAHEDEYYDQIERDRLKRELCVQNHIKLIEVTPFDLDFETLAAKIRATGGPADKLLLPLRSERPLIRELQGMCQSYMSHVRKSGMMPQSATTPA